MFLFREQYLAKMKLPEFPEFGSVLDHGLLDMKNKCFEGSEPTCCLVRMYIDDALANSMQAPTNLAANAPDVILRYVQRLTGVGERDTVMSVAKQAAKEMLSRDFVPQPLSRASLIEKLGEIFKNQPVGEALDRLVDGGIMESDFVAGSTHLSYVHDPVAEFLASIKVCEDYKGAGAVRWESYVATVKEAGARASGFIAALQVCLASYRKPLQLPDFMQIA